MKNATTVLLVASLVVSLSGVQAVAQVPGGAAAEARARLACGVGRIVSAVYTPGGGIQVNCARPNNQQGAQSALAAGGLSGGGAAGLLLGVLALAAGGGGGGVATTTTSSSTTTSTTSTTSSSGSSASR
ncbi:MAG: hypothetical protein AB8B51_00565 [Sedimentitalea sp.]